MYMSILYLCMRVCVCGYKRGCDTAGLYLWICVCIYMSILYVCICACMYMSLYKHACATAGLYLCICVCIYMSILYFAYVHVCT